MHFTFKHQIIKKGGGLKNLFIFIDTLLYNVSKHLS